MDPFLDGDGAPIPLDSVTDERWLDRFYPVLFREEPIRSHRYMKEAPGFRSWEDGEIQENGTLVTEYRTTFDGTTYKTIMPLLKTGSVSPSFNFHSVQEPRRFFPTVNYRGWPDFARVPPADAELKIAGIEKRSGRALYKVTHTSFWNTLTRGNVVYEDGLDPNSHQFDELRGTMNRDRHVILVDPQRGFEVVGWVFESALRRTPNEPFVVTRRTILDNVTMERDAAGQAWFPTAGRIREYITDPRGAWPARDSGDEQWPPKLILKGTSELITHEIAINSGIPDAAFTVEFPGGYAIYNQITGAAYTVGVAPDTAIHDAAELLLQATRHQNCWIHRSSSTSSKE